LEIALTLSVQTNGIVLRADVVGTGPGAVLLHAGGERRQVWQPVAERLAAAGFVSISMDLRGHGESGGARDDSVFRHAHDVEALLEACGGCPVVVGASLGGFAAMLALAARDRQLRAAGLVLVDVVPDPEPQRVRAFLNASTGGGGDRPLVTEILGHSDDFRTAARQLVLPVMLVRGARSAITDDEVERLRALVPHLRVATVENAGHLVARDAPEGLSAELLSFFLNDAVRDRRIDRFIVLAGGYDLRHPGGTLGKHLHRVGDTLRRWGEQPAVVDAGRLHAAYGTQGFVVPDAELATRDHVCRFVSGTAERLIELYCRCDRQPSYASWSSTAPVVVDRTGGSAISLSEAERCALIAITVANELDVMRHDEKLKQAHGLDLKRIFLDWRPWLCPAAQAEVDGWNIA
jgi:pimeloyl-ACP methyl ester carboxylesterase